MALYKIKQGNNHTGNIFREYLSICKYSSTAPIFCICKKNQEVPALKESFAYQDGQGEGRIPGLGISREIDYV